MKFIGSFAQRALVHLGMLGVGVLIVIFAVIPLAQGCDTAQANPYQALYEKQIVITDSIKTVLLDSMNLLSRVANRKIDSLKSIEYGLRYQIANTVCDSGAVIRYFNTTQLIPYLFVPLDTRLTEIIDSLNRK